MKRRRVDLLELAEANVARDQWMQWRARRYGRPCLTAREYEAMMLEMLVTAPLRPEETGDETAVQKRVAARMGISQQRVSQLLAKASEAMLYFEGHGIPARWRVERGRWLLDAPRADGTMSFYASSLVRANSRVMMKVS